MTYSSVNVLRACVAESLVSVLQQRNDIPRSINLLLYYHTRTARNTGTRALTDKTCGITELWQTFETNSNIGKNSGIIKCVLHLSKVTIQGNIRSRSKYHKDSSTLMYSVIWKSFFRFCGLLVSSLSKKKTSTWFQLVVCAPVLFTVEAAGELRFILYLGIHDLQYLCIPQTAVPKKHMVNIFFHQHCYNDYSIWKEKRYYKGWKENRTIKSCIKHSTKMRQINLF